MPPKRSCPRCSSENVEPVYEDVWGFRMNPSTWRCKNCGYSGFMPEAEK